MKENIKDLISLAKYTHYMNGKSSESKWSPYIITPTHEYFENNTIEEIELVVEQLPNIFDYEYILDQFAVDRCIQGFNTFNEAVEELKRLDPKNWEQSQNWKRWKTKNHR